MESLDESVVSKNSFCILVGAYLRKHAVSPKNVNIKEYEMLINAYKALFLIMQKDYKAAHLCYEKAIQCRSAVGSDVAQLTPALMKPATQQHASLLIHIRAMIEHVKGQDYKVIQTLFFGEKDLQGAVKGD